MKHCDCGSTVIEGAEILVLLVQTNCSLTTQNVPDPVGQLAVYLVGLSFYTCLQFGGKPQGYHGCQLGTFSAFPHASTGFMEIFGHICQVSKN